LFSREFATRISPKPVAIIKIDGGTTHFAGWIQP
jgi:hypothetical protein